MNLCLFTKVSDDKGKGKGRVSSDDPLAHPTRKYQGRASGNNPLALAKGSGKGRANGEDPLALSKGSGKEREINGDHPGPFQWVGPGVGNWGQPPCSS